MTVAAAKLYFEITDMIGLEYNWFLVYTRSHHEKKIKEACARLNVETYLPLEKRLRYWSGRKKMVDFPLFPNYLFVKASCREYVKILEEPSVIGFVKNGSGLSVVPEKIVHNVKKVLDEKLEYMVSPGKPDSGSEVTVISGPLAGLSGEVIQYSGKSHLLIELKQISRSVLVKIDKNSIGLKEHLMAQEILINK